MFVVLAYSPFALLRNTVLVIIATFATFLSVTIVYTILNCYLFANSVPNCIDTISVIEPFENTIASNHNKVKIILNTETLNIRFTNNYVWISTVFWTLCFNISKCFWYRQTARKNSEGALNIQIFFSRMCSSFCKSLCTIDFASCSLNTNFLKLIIWFMITT